jgi:hypothetical protein
LFPQLILGRGYITVIDKTFLFQVSRVKASPMFKDTAEWRMKLSFPILSLKREREIVKEFP